MQKLRTTILIAGIILVSSSAFAAIQPDGTSLMHAWNIQSVELFAIATTPDETMAGDMLDLNADMTFTAIVDGNALSGTYGIDQSNTWITLYISADNAMRIKVIESDATHIKTTRVDGDGNQTIVTYTIAD